MILASHAHGIFNAKVQIEREAQTKVTKCQTEPTKKGEQRRHGVKGKVNVINECVYVRCNKAMQSHSAASKLDCRFSWSSHLNLIPIQILIHTLLYYIRMIIIQN